MSYFPLHQGKQSIRNGIHEQGFTNQQALLLLLIIFPLGVITLGIGIIALQSPPVAINPQATDQPTTTSPEIAPAAVAPNDNEAAAAPGTDVAISTVNDWITAMSEGDDETARRLMTDGAKSLYSPEFFNQFQRVTVRDLQSTGQSGSHVNLNGIMTFVYRDGTMQRETRSFTVRTDPTREAQVTNTEFISVIKSRS